MKKSLMLLAMCLTSVGTYAQDDDVYFVPSSKDKVERTDSYAAGRSSYTDISSADSQTFQSDSWADHRGNGKWDVDAYNRRGRNYRGQNASDSTRARETASLSYDDGYDDGYEDGYYTSRLVRFWSPRVGVYVSSPFYLDYYDLCYYDPFYYGYASPWYGWGWSGWFGWGSWYGWRPYYSSWYGGWGWHGWYDPWFGPGYAWHPRDWWYPSNAKRGPVGGFVAYGGARGTGAGNASFGNAYRPSRSFNSGLNRGTSNGRFNYSGSMRPSRSFGNTNNNRVTPSRQQNDRNSTYQRSEQSRPSRSFGNSNQSAPSRSFSAPSRSGGSFGGGGRSFGGGGGGGRSFGGRR